MRRQRTIEVEVLPPQPGTDYSRNPYTKLRAALFQMHDLAEQSFRAQLAGAVGAEARGYVDKRAVAPAQVEQFGLGYAERSGRQSGGLGRWLAARRSGGHDSGGGTAQKLPARIGHVISEPHCSGTGSEERDAD